MPIALEPASLKNELEVLRKELDALKKDNVAMHCCLEKLGHNSRGTKDIHGRTFAVPVDDEHKALQLVLFDFTNPHGRAFHTSWFGFFSAFFSTFTAPPLMSKIRKESSLNLNGAQVTASHISAVSTNIMMRLLTGYICDIFGPRRVLAFLLFVSCPAMIGILWVDSPNVFIVFRAVIGISLATFVTSQVWCSQMYNRSVVGRANATSAGWGNMGGGMANLLMPYLFSAIYNLLDGEPRAKEDRAWRLCYFLPLAMHILAGCAALTGRDLPDGNMRELEKSGAKMKASGIIVLRTGISNVNAWLLSITYGMCFGVELTMNSVAALYFHDYHGLTPKLAGLLASLYGLMNLFARSCGGLLSDWSNARFGTRGRLWACWAVQSLMGIFCMLMASVTLRMDAPFEREQVTAFTRLDVPEAIEGWVAVNDTTIMACGAKEEAPPESFRNYYGVSDAPIMFLEPPFEREHAAARCISNSDAVGLAVFCMIAFSVCGQAAEGLHFGLVPYVSRPALGIVTGMVSAGGNLGAVILLWSFFDDGTIRLDEGFLRLGMMVCGLTVLLLLVYFPEHGGMLIRAGALRSYDPQLIKPPANYRGADSVRIFVLGQTMVIGR